MHKEKISFEGCYEGLDAPAFIYIFLFASFAGVVLEMIFCLLTKGVLQSRTGMVIGPFNQVYGVGAVLLTLILLPAARLGNVGLFFTGAVVGGLFETLCSLVQEKAFGTVSWRYAGEPLALFGGRTSVPLMLCWGTLGVVYVRLCYPLLLGLVGRIPYRGVLAALVAVFLCGNMLLSALAVGRWTQRQTMPMAESHLAVYLDKHFPDDKMQRIYPSMQWLETTESEEAAYEYTDLH